MLTHPLAHVSVLLIFGALLLVAAAADLRWRIIPNALCLAIAALYPVHVVAAPVTVDWTMALIVAGLSLAVGVVAFARGYVGGGDTKLFAAIALWAGPRLFSPFVLAAAFTGFVLALLLLARRHWPGRPVHAAAASDLRGESAPDPSAATMPAREVPYGVALATGGLTVAALLFTGG